MTFFESAGFRIAFTDEGAGPPILLIHGFASSARVNWHETSWVSTLTKAGRRVVAIDNRGHGQSAAPRETAAYALPGLADDALRLLDHLAIHRTAVMGYSMGARIAALLAIGHPDRVSSLILGGIAGGLVAGMAKTEIIARGLEAPTLEEISDDTARSFRAFADRTGSDRAALAAAMRTPRDVIAAGDLGRLSLPILAAVGSRDTLAGPIGELAVSLPQAELFEIAGRNHMNAVGDRTFKAAVLDFLERNDPPQLVN